MNCPDCGNEIEPDICRCGSAKHFHGMELGHSFVPAGCTCGYVKQPPKPDPFEEWWERDGCLVCASRKDSKFIWDAAIKWKEGK